MAEQSLKAKTVKGVGWSAVDNVAQYAVSFIVSIVLARILSPDDYGLLGIIAIFTAICTALVGGGFSEALIRKKDAKEEDYSTVFISNLIISLLLYAVIFFLAPLIAVFFKREELIALTRVASFGIIIGALAIVQHARLTKRLDFRTQTKITLLSSITSGILGIVLALLGCGVWSLVAQTLSSQLLRTVFLWFFNKWAPKLHFSQKSFHELFGFGWKIMASRLLDTTWQEFYQVVVGKFYSPATLGQYTRAKQFSQLLSKNLTGIIQRVTFPVLSEMQDDRAHMTAAYRRIIKTTMFVTAISSFALGAISEPLLYCLIGPKWHEAATFLPLICVAGSLYPLHAINLNMLAVQGRSDITLMLEIIKKLFALAPLFVGAFVGIMPMLYVNLVVGFISFFLNSSYSGKLLGYSSWMQLKDVSLSYGIAIIVALSVWFFKYLPISNWIILPLQIVVGVIVFFVSCRIFRPVELGDIKDMIRTYTNKLKKNPQ